MRSIIVAAAVIVGCFASVAPAFAQTCDFTGQYACASAACKTPPDRVPTISKAGNVYTFVSESADKPAGSGTLTFGYVAVSGWNTLATPSADCKTINFSNGDRWAKP